MVLKKPVVQLVLVATVFRCSFLGSNNGIQDCKQLLRSASVDVGGMSSNTTMPSTPASNLSEPRFRFWFENFEDEPHVCGFHKCIFKNKYDRRIGYLAAGSRTPEMVHAMDEAYKFNLEVIEKKYGMKNVLLAPPHIVEVDDAFLEWAKKNQETAYAGQLSLPRYKRTVLVQPVEMVQKNESVLFGCEPLRFWSGVNLLESLYNVNNTQGKNLNVIAETVSSEFAKLYSLLEDHTCLIDNFQIFLTNQGRLINLDVDRCFLVGAYKRGKINKKLGCIQFIHSFEVIVIQQLHLLAQFYSGLP